MDLTEPYVCIVALSPTRSVLLTSLILSFLIYKMELKAVTALWASWKG